MGLCFYLAISGWLLAFSPCHLPLGQRRRTPKAAKTKSSKIREFHFHICICRKCRQSRQCQKMIRKILQIRKLVFCILRIKWSEMLLLLLLLLRQGGFCHIYSIRQDVNANSGPKVGIRCVFNPHPSPSPSGRGEKDSNFLFRFSTNPNPHQLHSQAHSLIAHSNRARESRPHSYNIRCEEGMGYHLEEHFVTLSQGWR